MRIAIYTLTRDRLEYTKHCFDSLYKNADGYPFDHYVLDNGSMDGTADWLKNHPTSVNKGCQFKAYLMEENMGISRGSNFLLERIFEESGYDLIIKMDNDCEVISKNILQPIAELFENLNFLGLKMILSPRVTGINNQPTRVKNIELSGHPVGITGIVGGLFHIVQSDVYRDYRYPIILPKAWGQDDDFCEWARLKNIRKGYIEDLVVNHFETAEGQQKRFPEYFERKFKEEKEI